MPLAPLFWAWNQQTSVQSKAEPPQPLANFVNLHALPPLQLDGQIQGMLERKAARQRGPGPEPSSGSGQRSALDLASEGLRLRTEMQRAVEEERWVWYGKQAG